MVPSKQKFGYSNRFSVPARVAMQVPAYTDNERHAIAQRAGGTSQMIFLNERTGEPLTPSVVLGLFSKAQVR